MQIKDIDGFQGLWKILREQGLSALLVGLAMAGLFYLIGVWLNKVSQTKLRSKTNADRGVTAMAIIAWLMGLLMLFSFSALLYLVMTGGVLSYHYSVGWYSTHARSNRNVLDGGFYAAIISLFLLMCYISATTHW